MTNTRFEELENRVKKLKQKKYLKISLVFFLLFGLSYYVIMNNSSKETVQKKLHVKEVVKPKIQKYEAIKQEIKKEKKIVKIEKIKPIVKEKKLYDTIKLSPTLSLVNTDKIVKIEEEKPQNKKKLSLHVKEVKSEDALLERFKVAGDFDSALALAKLYFQKNRFEKSIHWSKKASKLNSGDKTAWLVYAKSKKALNKTEDAIKALQLYLEYFSSDEVTKLLKTYRKNK